MNDIINAAVVLNFSEARDKAIETDQRIASLDSHRIKELLKRKPLLGIPYTCKDAIAIKGKEITCGIFDQIGAKCATSAEVIRRMDAAGAILLAITNVPEVCMCMETTNGIYGRTNNPYDGRRSAGGSSGGEGALIGAAGSLIGIGSDIGGSIRIPAFMNGIFGMKNTPGVIPLEGHIPEARDYQKQMLKIGPMCRYVEDIPLLIKVMGGDCVPPLRLHDPVDFKKIRLLYMEGIRNAPSVEPLSADMKSTLLKAVEHFETKYDIEAIRLDFPLFAKSFDIEFVSLQARDEPKMGDYLLSIRGNKGYLNGFAEMPKLLAGTSNHSAGGVLYSMLESINKTTEEEKAEILRLRERLVRQLAEVLRNDGILMFPSWPQTAPFHNQSLFTLFNITYTSIFNALTFPVIQCPMGLDDNGLPLGIQVVAGRHCDRLLISAAKEISSAFGGWIPPWTR